MTLKDIISKVTSWSLANEASDRISKELAAIRREYVKRDAIMRWPNGKKEKGYIVAIDWDSSVGLNGGWCVLFRLTEGELIGKTTWTDDKSLEFTS